MFPNSRQFTVFSLLTFTLFQYPVQGPYRTRITKYLTDGHSQTFHLMLRNVQYIHGLQENGLGKGQQVSAEDDNSPPNRGDVVKLRLHEVCRSDGQIRQKFDRSD